MRLRATGIALPCVLIAILAILAASFTAGCSSSHLKANMTQIREKYDSIKSMSGTAIVKEGNSNDTVLFTFVKPNEFLEWYSSKNKIIVYNGSVELIQDNTGKKIVKEKPFNPYDYGKILNGGKAYVSGNSIIVENSLGKVWLNEKLLPEKIEWKRGVTVEIAKLSINGPKDEQIILDFMGGKKESAPKANRMVSIPQAERMAGFNFILPKYTSTCRFIGAIVSNSSGTKVVTLYYGDMNTNRLLTIVESPNEKVLYNVSGMSGQSTIEIGGIKVTSGVALGKWQAYGFRVDNVSVIVYGNLTKQEMLKVLESMI